MAVLQIPFISRHLSPAERMGELLFGLIMTLSFTLTAGLVVGDGPDAVRELLVATIGCNIAWGIIDGGLLVLGRAFDRGRIARIGLEIRSSEESAPAIAAVAEELDPYLATLAPAQSRERLYTEIVERVRTGRPERAGIHSEDWLAALGVFLLVVSASIPAALPFLLVDEAWQALRVSNAILIGLFFVIGYRWAGYTSINPWRAATSLMLFGMAMVATAIALGG